MLGTDRSAPAGDEIVDEAADRLALIALPSPADRAGRGENMEMDVSVAQMTEGDGSGSPKAGFDLRDGGLDEIISPLEGGLEAESFLPIEALEFGRLSSPPPLVCKPQVVNIFCNK